MCWRHCSPAFRAQYPRHVQVESFEEPPVEAHDVTLFTADEAFDGTIVARKIASTRGILVATPDYLRRMGIPVNPQDLVNHHCLELKGGIARHRRWHLRNELDLNESIDLNLTPVLSSNHIETLISATLDGAGITPCTVELVAPFLASGDLAGAVAVGCRSVAPLCSLAQPAVFAEAHPGVFGLFVGANRIAAGRSPRGLRRPMPVN